MALIAFQIRHGHECLLQHGQHAQLHKVSILSVVPYNNSGRVFVILANLSLLYYICRDNLNVLAILDTLEYW